MIKNRLAEDAVTNENSEEAVDKDTFRLHFENWLDIRELDSANQRLSVSHTMVTGAGVSVTSGNASVNVSGIDAFSSEIDFIELEHLLQLDDSQIARVGVENEAMVIDNAKAVIMKQYDQMFWQWYVGGGAIASRAINGQDLVNPKALLSMQSQACHNVKASVPSSYNEWLQFFELHVSTMQSQGNLVGNQLTMLIDPALRRAMDSATPMEASLLLSDRIQNVFGIEFVPEYQLLNTGKLLIFDPQVMSVKFVIGKDASLRQLRSGVTDGWEKAGNTANNEVYRSATHAIMGNVIVLQANSMLAVELL